MIMLCRKKAAERVREDDVNGDLAGGDAPRPNTAALTGPVEWLTTVEPDI